MPQNTPPAGRIVIALNEGPHARSALEEAARLAAALSLELQGVFVADAELIRAATLPIAALVSFEGAESRKVDELVIRRSIRVHARRLERLLAGVAEAHGVAWSFEIREGGVAEQLMLCASAQDILALGSSTRGRARGAWGETARAVFAEAKCHLFLAYAKSGARGILVFVGSSARPYELGRSLANAMGVRMRVQPVGPLSSEPVQGILSELGRAGSKAQLLEAIPADPAAMLDAIARQEPSYIVMERSLIAALTLTVEELSERFALKGVLLSAGPDTDELTQPSLRQ